MPHTEQAIKKEEECGYGCGREWNAQGKPGIGFEDCVSAYHVPRSLADRFETRLLKAAKDFKECLEHDERSSVIQVLIEDLENKNY